MKKLLVCVLWFGLVAGLRAQDPALMIRQAIDSYKVNGAVALAKALYPDDLEYSARASEQVSIQARALGPCYGGEIVDIVTVTKQVQRIYCVIYCARSPLWFRVDWYTVNGRSVFLPLEASVRPEEILPENILPVPRVRRASTGMKN